MIVVTSTAKRAVGFAGACTQSVRRAAELSWCTRHIFVAVDEETEEDARAGAWAGLETRVEPYKSQLENLIEMWMSCRPSDIIVHLDGDDELTPQALLRVDQMYEDPDVWLTYGSFMRDDGVLDHEWHHAFGRRYSRGIDPRKDWWRASHLKTFRAGLVQHLITQHPRYLISRATGVLFDTCLDLAVMFPLLDFARERYAVSHHVNVLYNYTHSYQALFGPSSESPEAGRDRLDIRDRERLPALEHALW